jgi:hypothetical protein
MLWTRSAPVHADIARRVAVINWSKFVAPLPSTSPVWVSKNGKIIKIEKH